MKRSIRATITVAATAATALFGAGLTVSAQATTGPLTLNPGVTSVGIVNLDRNASKANALSGYGIKVNGLPAKGAHPRLQLVSAPAGGRLQYLRVSGNDAPTPDYREVDWPTSSTVNVTAALSKFKSGDNLYLGVAIVPGTYVVRIFNDENRDGNFQSTDESTTPDLTIRAYDVTNPVQASNDWAPTVIYLPAGQKYGQHPKVTVGFGGLTTIDVRGVDSAGLPRLGWWALGRNLEWYLDGAGYKKKWISIDHFSAGAPAMPGSWYRVAPNVLKDVALLDSIDVQVRLGGMSGATWQTARMTLPVTF